MNQTVRPSKNTPFAPKTDLHCAKNSRLAAIVRAFWCAGALTTSATALTFFSFASTATAQNATPRTTTSPSATSSTRIVGNGVQPLPPPLARSTPARVSNDAPKINSPISPQIVVADAANLPVKLAFPDDIISNATSSDLSGVRARLADLARLLSARDANALQLFGWKNEARALPATPVKASRNGKAAPLPNASDSASKVFVALSPATIRITVSHLAVTDAGALARVTIEAPFSTNALRMAARSNSSDANASATGTIAGDSYDIWLQRSANSNFVLTQNVWNRARGAADFLSDEADNFWRQSSTRNGDSKNSVTDISTDNAVIDGNAALALSSNSASAPPQPVIDSNDGDIMDLVAEYRGGQWLPLRASVPWQGALLDNASLARSEALQIRVANTAANAANFAKSSTRFAANDTNSTPSNALPSPELGNSRSGLRVREQTAAQFSDLQNAPISSRSTKSKNAAFDNSQPAWSVKPWLVAQMQRYTRRPAGTAHFIFQRGARGWVGVNSIFEPAKEGTDSAYTAAENAARTSRLRIDGASFTSAAAHRDFAVLLSRVQLWNEAADEIAKTRLLQPDLVTEKQERDFDGKRVLDPQLQEAAQRDALKRVGFAPEHPILRVPQLLSQFRDTSSPLIGLRLGLEYSRLGYEREASDMLNYGDANATRFLSLPMTSAVDAAWFRVLRDQLKSRLQLAANKPSNLIRSSLFTVRGSLNDPNAPQLLAGLENAQYKIYSSFGVPMGNTEVILWSSQNLFQNYTTRQAGRNTSEFVTALTITQLVNADVGPVVLGEEINFYADARADSISTIAHEYGHIAVRALAKGRSVPDWLNEGIATYTEGGYDNYLRRVRSARQTRKLLSMRELMNWGVDGDRAFVAYSQANSMIDFIVARWGNDAILEILRQIGRDIPPNTALKNVLKVSPDGFYALWLQNGIK